MPGNCQLPILLVDDNEAILKNLKSLLLLKGFCEVVTVCDSPSVLPFLENRDVGAIVLDLMMPKLTGQRLLKLLTAKHPTVPVIILTAQNQLETAIDCMKNGACDYLLKPLDYDKFLSSINRALEFRALNEEVFTLKRSLLPERFSREDDFSYIITQNTAMRELLRYVEVIAPTRQPVLILGETGVGKELFARALHQASGEPGL